MSLTIKLNEPEMAALAEIAQIEGSDPAEYASQILHSHLAPIVHLLGRPKIANGANHEPANVVSTAAPTIDESSLTVRQPNAGTRAGRPSARTLQGKYSHLKVSSETIHEERRAEVEQEETRYARHFENPRGPH